MAKIDEEIKNKFQNDKHRLIANLVYTANWFQNLINEYLKPYGLSLQQFNILRILRGAGDWLTMNDIKNRMVEKSPNTTRLADKLIEKELVKRRRSDTDRRIVYLAITDEGMKLVASIDNAESNHMDFLNKITEGEAKQASETLDKLRG